MKTLNVSIRFALVLLFVCLAVGKVRGEAEKTEDTPLMFFRQRLERTKKLTVTFDNVSPNLAEGVKHPGRFLSAGDPEQAADLKTWSNRP